MYVFLGWILGETGFVHERKKNIWKRWWLGLACFRPVLPLYSAIMVYPIDLLHILLGWFLYNGYTGLNCKVDAEGKY